MSKFLRHTLGVNNYDALDQDGPTVGPCAYGRCDNVISTNDTLPGAYDWAFGLARFHGVKSFQTMERRLVSIRCRRSTAPQRVTVLVTREAWQAWGPLEEQVGICMPEPLCLDSP
jgi:hypothetical protein